MKPAYSTKATAFSVSEACRAAGSATPRADRRRRLALFAWVPVILAAALALNRAGGALAGMATLAAGLGLLATIGAKTNRRRRMLWTTPFPDKYERFLLRRVPHYRSLDEPGRELFRRRVALFLDGAAFHGAGVKVTDGLRLRAAAAAATATLGFEEWEWPELKEIIFRPAGYEHGVHEGEDGVVTEYEESGMIGVPGDMAGTMMLSRDDLVWEFAHPEEGMNVGIHEFAHLMTAGGLTLAPEDHNAWPALVKAERARIQRGESLLDEYALVDEDELFAVASELFFSVPRRFHRWHPELYAVLVRCYRQDPAQWLDTGEPEPDNPPRRRKRRAGKGRMRTGKRNGPVNGFNDNREKRRKMGT